METSFMITENGPPFIANSKDVGPKFNYSSRRCGALCKIFVYLLSSTMVSTIITLVLLFFYDKEIRAKEALSYEQKVEATYSSLLQDSIRNQDSVSVQLSKLRGQVQTLDEEKSDLVSYISEHFANLEEQLEDQKGFRQSYNLTLVEFERRLEEVKSDLKQEQERLRENCEKKFDSFERALEDLRSSFEKRARETEKQFEVVRLSFDSIEEDHLESKEEIKRHHTKSHEVFANQTRLDLEELQSDLLGEMLNLRGELANKTAFDFAKVIQDVVQGYTEPIGRLEKAFEMQQQHIREALSHMGNQTETDFEELAVNLWKTLHSVERGIIDEFKYILTSTVDSAVQESSHKFESLSEHLEYFRKVSKNERQRIEDEISILESTWDPDTFGRLSKFLANTETFSDTMGKYWKRSGPNFYSFSKSSLSFDSAQAVCSSVGATLAEFPSTTEFTAFAQSLPHNFKPNNFWIGGSDRGRSVGSFAWIDSQAEIPADNWHPGEPNNWNDQEHCLESSRGSRWKWNDNNCETAFRFVCQQKFAPFSSVMDQANPGILNYELKFLKI